MTAHRIPRSLKAATALLERFATIEGEIAHIDGIRNTLIAEANANADRSSEQLLQERAQILAKLEPWWKDAAAGLTEGKRKSIELGGCIVGSRSGRPSLEVDGPEETVIDALKRRSWGMELLRVRFSLDRAAILKSIDGVYKRQLAGLGLRRKAGDEVFYVERAEQGGTLAETAS